MPLDIVVGTQWGDEGKGRITDLMAAHVDIVARYSGGDNAGHTVTVGDEIFKLHLVPSGIIHPKASCLLGSGVVINPATLLRELSMLDERGIDISADRIKISGRAHLITPAHIELDRAREAARGDDAIGTTLRGIGPAYTDKAGRNGIRASLLTDPEALADAVQQHVAQKNDVLVKMYGADPLDADAVAATFVDYARQLGPYIDNVPAILHQALADEKVVLAEGAQGTMLDINYGTYPYVTSSSPTASGALVGLGVGPHAVGRVVGVAKAFSSRVGGGPFVSELDGAAAHRLRGSGDKPWDEYGTTTGRPRRVGWLDLVVLRHAVNINSMSELVLTKLDILSGLDEIPVCVAYECDGKRIDTLPMTQEEVARCTPILETLPGWQEDVTGARIISELPQAAQDYVAFIAKDAGIPVTMVSVGPARTQVALSV